jgi:hypothetical protein
MELREFKLIRNKQQPDFCYNYKAIIGKDKFEIFTMNGGKTFLASKETQASDGTYLNVFKENVNSVDEALAVLSI